MLLQGEIMNQKVYREMEISPLSEIKKKLLKSSENLWEASINNFNVSHKSSYIKDRRHLLDCAARMVRVCYIFNGVY